MAETAKSGILTAKKSKPGQWKMIVPLIGMLVFLNAYGGEEEDSDKNAVAPLESSMDPSLTHYAEGVRRDIAWPEVSLEFLLMNNPFHAQEDEAAEIAEPDGHTETLSPESDQNFPPDDMPVVSSSPPVTDMATTPVASVAPNPLAENKVSMVISSARVKAAMIDGKIYYEGDRIGEFAIVSIARDGVTLRPAEEPSP